MKILAINTSGSNGEICLIHDSKMYSKKLQSPYSEHIAGDTMNILELAGLNVDDIDTFGVVTGPGSFTGIRIGMAFLKGILSALDKKCIAINSFELVSYNISESNFVVILDSGNTDAYYAIFKDKKVLEIGFGTVEKVYEFAKKQDLKVYFSSFESDKFDSFDNLTKVDINDDTLAKLVCKRAEQNDFTTLEKLSPIYIKLSQAEIGLEQKMKENLSFRVAEKNDINALEVVDEQCFEKGTERYSSKSFEGELLEPSKHYIVALYQNLVIGYIGVQRLGDELNLLKIAVLPQYQKLGVGFKLMELSFEYKRQNNLQNYFLEVREDNQNAIRLYQKFGFKTKSKREKYYSDGTDALVMFAK